MMTSSRVFLTLVLWMCSSCHVSLLVSAQATTSPRPSTTPTISTAPSITDSTVPSSSPSWEPSIIPTVTPSSSPSVSAAPSIVPSIVQSTAPSSAPTDKPTFVQLDDTNSNNWVQDNKGALAGIVIGAIVLLVILGFLLKKKSKHNAPTDHQHYTQPLFPIPDPEESPRYEFDHEIDDSSQAVEVFHRGPAY